jgi:predicted dehydrogenase
METHPRGKNMEKNTQHGAKLRFGLVGAGRIGQTYAEALRGTPNAHLTAIVDSSESAASTMARHEECKTYLNHIDLADSGAVDAVVIATPPAFHGTIAIDLLRRGIPVLCEKPVSFDLETARMIRRTARENRVLFTMASKFRYVDDVIKARKIVGSGILGDVVLFENTFMSYVDMSRRWNADSRISGGGVLIDNGTHSVDIMRYFIGPLSMIQAIEGPSIQGLPVDETVHVNARAEQGAIGRMDLSWSINKQTDDYIAIYGSKGTLRVGWKASLYRQAGSSNWVQFGNGYDKVQAFHSQIVNFSAAIQGLDQLLIDANDAIASVEVIQAGYESLKHDSWTQVPADELIAAAA